MEELEQATEQYLRMLAKHIDLSNPVFRQTCSIYGEINVYLDLLKKANRRKQKTKIHRSYV